MNSYLVAHQQPQPQAVVPFKRDVKDDVRQHRGKRRLDVPVIFILHAVQLPRSEGTTVENQN